LFKKIILGIEDASLKEGSKITLNLEKHSIKDIILKDVIQLLEDTTRYDRKEIQPRIANLPDLRVDKEMITQVFINLLRNAIQYSDRYSVIEIEYNEINETFDGNYKQRKWHEIKFINKGIGIPEEDRETIFKRYKRAANAIALRPNGNGIGLFLCRKFMIAHGGHCLVRRCNGPTEIAVLFPIT
jgi:signal transduction histidine kinase